MNRVSRYFYAHWRGELSVAVSLLVNGLLFYIILVAAFVLVGQTLQSQVFVYVGLAVFATGGSCSPSAQTSIRVSPRRHRNSHDAHPVPRQINASGYAAQRFSNPPVHRWSPQRSPSQKVGDCGTGSQPNAMRLCRASS